MAEMTQRADEETVQTFQKCLDDWNFIGALQCLDNPGWRPWLEKNAALELTPAVVTFINDEQEVKGPHMVNGCSQILVKLAGFGSPKESLIALIEHCEAFVSSLKFRNVLPALGVVLRRLHADPKARRRLSLTWDWTLDTLAGHIRTLTPPDTPDCLASSEERLLLDSDKETLEVLQTVDVFAEFLIPLHKQIQQGDEEEGFECRAECKDILVRTCMVALANPLAFVNIENHVTKSGAQIKSRGLIIAEKLVSIVAKLEPDVYTLIEFGRRHARKDTFGDVEKEEAKERSDWTVSVGVLFFVLFNDMSGPDISQRLDLMAKAPCVHDPTHVLNNILPSINALMTAGLSAQDPNSMHDTSHHLCLYKSLALADSLIGRIAVHSQDGVLLELGSHSDFLQNVLKVVVYDPVESFRRQAFSVFEKYFKLFSPGSGGCYRLCTVLFDIANHSGVIGYVVGKVKDVVINDLNGKQPAPMFRGHELQVLVRKFAKLSNGAETDLLEVSDEVMAALNFMICVFLRDKANTAGLWDLKDQLEKEFLGPLETGINMSRAHYKASLDGKKADVVDDVVSLRVGGQPLPQMTPEQRKEFVHAALNNLSMMECVLIQLKDILDRK